MSTMNLQNQKSTRIRGLLLSLKRLTRRLWNRSNRSNISDRTGPYVAAWLVSWPIPGKDDVPLRWEDGSGLDYVHRGIVQYLTDTGLYHRGADAVGFLLESEDGLAPRVVALVCTRDAKTNVDMNWTIDLDVRHRWGGHAEVIAAGMRLEQVGDGKAFMKMFVSRWKGEGTLLKVDIEDMKTESVVGSRRFAEVLGRVATRGPGKCGLW